MSARLDSKCKHNFSWREMEITYSREIEKPSKAVICRGSWYHISETMNCKIKTANSAWKGKGNRYILCVRKCVCMCVCVCLYACIPQRTLENKGIEICIKDSKQEVPARCLQYAYAIKAELLLCTHFITAKGIWSSAQRRSISKLFLYKNVKP